MLIALCVLAGWAWRARVYWYYPQALFPYRLALHNLSVSSDLPIPDRQARAVLERVEAKLAASPLNEPTLEHRAFLCHQAWRRSLYLGDSIGGCNVFGCTGRSLVFLRSVRWEDNRLLSPRNRAIKGKRTLDYYLTHEFTHSLVAKTAPGTPRWLDEGSPFPEGRGRRGMG